MNRRNFFLTLAAAAAGSVAIVSSGNSASQQSVALPEADLPAPNAIEVQGYEYDNRGGGRSWGDGDGRARRGPPEWNDGRRGPPPWSQGRGYGYREERRRPRQVCRLVRNQWGEVRRVCTWR